MWIQRVSSLVCNRKRQVDKSPLGRIRSDYTKIVRSVLRNPFGLDAISEMFLRSTLTKREVTRAKHELSSKCSMCLTEAIISM